MTRTARFHRMNLIAFAVFCSIPMLLPRAVRAQNALSPPVDATTTIRVSSQEVILDAMVDNRKTGGFVGDLERSDFRLTEDGVPQTLTYFSQDRLPLSVVFLFDLTDTVRPVLKPLAAGASEILGHLKPQDEVAIMVFSSHTELVQGFTTDHALAAAAIEKASEMKTKDGTFIHESMYEGIQQAMQSNAPGSRRVMIWLTDGSANYQDELTRGLIAKGAPERLHSKEEATEALLHSGVVVSALIERTAGTDLAIVNPFQRVVGVHMGDVRKYAEMTGGPVLETSKKEVAVRLAELVDQIRSRYTLGYRPSTAKPDGTFCKLDLQVDAKALKSRSDVSKVVVRTRRGYYR